jgi:hypothetical protein
LLTQGLGGICSKWAIVQAVQLELGHGCGVAEEKTNDRGDVFTFGKSSEQDPGEHWAAFGGIAPGSLTHAG